MNRALTTLGLTLLACHLAGCGQGFTQGEAEVVADGTTMLTAAAFTALSSDLGSASRRGTVTEFDWEEIDDGYAFVGSLMSDGPLWWGTMAFDGSLVGDEDSAGWRMGVDLDECEIDDVTLDGHLDWRWEAAWTGSQTHIASQTTGSLTAWGAAEGTGAIDTTTTLDIGGGDISYELTGTIDDKPVEVSFSVFWPF